MQQAYIGIGSNLTQPIEQVRTALAALQCIPKTTLTKTSSFYYTQPWGVIEQPKFINCVVAVDTEISALTLLHELHLIENQQGRLREVRYGPRTIDLDILLYANEIIDTPDLIIPHPRMAERNFVLYPLAEIAPTLCMPDGRLLALWLDSCSLQGIERLDE